MHKISRTLVPTIFGILAVWGLFRAMAFVEDKLFVYKEGFRLEEGIKSDLIVIVPFAIIALFVHALFTLPLRDKFKGGKRILNLNQTQLFLLTCISGGLIFGIVSGIEFGIKDVMMWSLIGTLYLCVYFVTSLFVLIRFYN